MQDRVASYAKNRRGDKIIKIEFPFDLDLLEKVRSIPGRKWHKELNCWSAPLFTSTLYSLISWGFTLDILLDQFLADANHRSDEILGDSRSKLYPFQSEGVAFLEQTKGRALIADEMGLGKTIQALAWLEHHPELRPAIIIVPASLKYNWGREASKWLTSPDIEILQGTTPWQITGNIVIINYDILFNWIEQIRQTFPKVIITDECHYYRNNSAKRTKAVKKVARKVPHFIALSGTPIVNRPVEAFNALHIINPELFPDYWRYVHRYCAARNNGFGLDVSGASHKEELHSILDKTIMLRRLKKDVLKELPAKVRSFVPLEFVSKEYKIAEDDFIQYIKDTKGEEAAERAVAGETFTRIAELKQLAVRGKLKAAIIWIKDFLEIEDKLVVFATHKFVITALMEEFGKVAVKVDGSVSQAERQRSVDAFQSNTKVKLFVGNIKAAGVGITLTASSNVAFLELPWSPGDLEQAEDRCHRIGQKNSVNIYYLLARDTIEEQIAKQIDQKRKVLGQVLDGEEVETESLLINLIHSYRK